MKSSETKDSLSLILKIKVEYYLVEGVNQFWDTKGGSVKPSNYVSQVNWILDSWKKIHSEIIKKSFETYGIIASDVTKMHYLKEGQPTEEAGVLSGESDVNLELMATLTLDDDVDFEVENIEDVNNITDKLMEGVVEIQGRFLLFL